MDGGKRTGRYAQVCLGGADEGAQLSFVLASHVGHDQYGGSFLVHDRAESCFTLNDDVGYSHLATEGRDEYHELDGVNVVGEDDKGGLLGFYESHGMI